MKVSRAQAEENRRAVIAAAARLFRECGVDGIGLNDLMNAAGLTRGGFYNQFESKEDLVVRASERALAVNVAKWVEIVEGEAKYPFAKLVRAYLSGDHRDRTGEGCAFAALGSDASRQSRAVRLSFEAGVNAHLDVVHRAMSEESCDADRDASIAALSTMVGALLLSRVVEDKTLSKRILDAATSSLLARAEAVKGIPVKKPAGTHRPPHRSSRTKGD